MTDFLRLVGEQIRMIRQARDLSQEKLGEKCGIKNTRISDIERGQSNASLRTLEKIMIALDISPNELFNFQRLNAAEGIEDKRLLVEIHKSLLMERGLDEVKYVIDDTKKFLNAMDTKDSKRKPRT